MSDLLVSRHGGLVIVTGVSANGHEWLETRVGNEESMRYAGGIVFEPRYVAVVVEVARDEGLAVKVETIPVRRARAIAAPGRSSSAPERGR